MITERLQREWNDWLAASDRLLASLHEQTAAVVLRDVERTERLQPTLDGLMAELRELDERALATSKRLAEEQGVEPTLRSLVASLDKAEGQQLQALANRVIVAARKVQEVIDKNQTLLHEELDYIGGTLALVAQAAESDERPFVRTGRQAAVVLDRVV